MGKIRILLKGRRHFPIFSNNTVFSFQSAIVLLALTLYKHSGAKRPYSHYPSKHHQQSFNNEKTEKSKHISITYQSYKWEIKQIIKIRRYHNECYTLAMSRAVLRHATLNFYYYSNIQLKYYSANLPNTYLCSYIPIFHPNFTFNLHMNIQLAMQYPLQKIPNKVSKYIIVGN